MCWLLGEGECKLPSQFNQRERKRQTNRQALIKYASKYIIIIWDEWCEGIMPVNHFLISWQMKNNSQALRLPCAVSGTSHWWSHMVEDADFALDEQPLPLPCCAVRMPCIWALSALSRTKAHLPGPSCWQKWDKAVSFMELWDWVQSELPNSRCTSTTSAEKAGAFRSK